MLVEACWLSRDPIGEAGGLNLYAYVGNDPVGAVDADGLRITWDTSDASAQANIQAAITYLSRSPTAATIIQQLQHSPANFHITSTIYHENIRTIPADPALGGGAAIVWAPTLGMLTTSGGGQSAALVLFHEMAHAAAAACDYKGYNDRRADKIANFDDAEERRVITGPETTVARELGGEGTRQDHRDNGFVSVSSPTTIPHAP